MHFEGAAARWIQSVERKLRNTGWEEFCSMIHNRFGHDQHEALIRQLFHIRQTGSVAEYVEQFSALVDQLTAYEAEANPLYYAMRFVDGLRDEIRSVVMVQRPATLDSACALALIQEEALDGSRKKEHRRPDSFGRQYSKPAFPLPLPPRIDKPLNTYAVEDRKGAEAARTANSDDKLRALRQYRRAHGLCDKCAEKWHYGHKCSPTVQLHVVQELWELIDEDFPDGSVGSAPDSPGGSAQLCLCVSAAAISGVESPKSMRFLGQIQGHPVMILVDSGSSHTFVSTAIASQMAGMSS
jgi:hypothetical protein